MIRAILLAFSPAIGGVAFALAGHAAIAIAQANVPPPLAWSGPCSGVRFELKLEDAPEYSTIPARKVAADAWTPSNECAYRYDLKRWPARAALRVCVTDNQILKHLDQECSPPAELVCSAETRTCTNPANLRKRPTA